MITEMLLLYAGYSTYNYLKNLDLHHFKYEFNEIMKSLKLQNKLEQTYKIKYVYKTTYGFKCRVVIPYGLSISKLNSNIDILQDNLNGIIQIDKDKFKPLATMKIVMKDIDKFIYEPVKTKPNELYVGKLFDGKNFIIDLNKDPMLLIAGCTGTGKSMLMSVIFANLEYNSSKYIDTYLLQSMKSELSSFDECKSVIKACYDEFSCYYTLNKIVDILNKRSELFKQNGIRNIEQWNKHHKKDYMKRIIILIEELSFFMNSEESFSKIADICKAGRSVGIHIISCIQRTTAENMNTTVKSQMSKITFRQKSMIDSQNVINTNDATKLKERECIFDGNSNYELIKTPYIDDDFVILNKYVPEIKTPTNNIKQSQFKQDSNDNHKEVNNNITIDELNNTIQYMETHSFIEVSEEDIIEDTKCLPKPNNKRFKGKEKIND